MALKSISEILGALRDRLSDVAGIQTCKIGLEPNMTPADYPIIRLVPSIIGPSDASRRKLDLLVYYGAPLQAFDGLDAVYGELLRLEEQIVERMRIGDGYRIRHVETITDEDRISTYKLFMSRFEVVG